MEFSDVVLKRRIVRNFTDEPVDPDVIARIMDLTRHAPSAGYTQGQSFVVITDPDMRKAVARLCGEEEYYPGQGFGPWISKAPVMVIACVSETAYHKRYQEPDKVLPDGTEIDWPVPYWYMDISRT